ncbi:MAG TPA: glycosyltransferase family 39 protein [Patescibacteria group bacterium]|nr:glycosyltransferase family 39 protein [Patescibacteria group bacterium]
MKSLWKRLHQLGDRLHLPNLPEWLCGILALVLILRIPTFFEPYNYGDEMIYLTLGQGVRQGLVLYEELHDNKPPLLYLTAAAAGSLFWFKAILAAWSIFTIILFYKLAKKLFEKNTGAQKLSTLIFALLTTIPLFEGTTVNSELFMIGFTIWALLILLGQKLTKKNLFWAGVLLGIGTLFKVPAAFDAPVIILYWVITKGLSKWKEILNNSLILVVGFATPLVLSFVYFFLAGAGGEYIRAAFMQNVGYLSSFRPGDVRKPFFVRNGPLLLRAFVVFAGTGIVYFFRRKLSGKFILFSVWLLLALFAITLSERPYPHYFIQAIAPVSFFLAMLFSEKNREQSLSVIPLAIAFLVPVFFRFYLYPTTTYYLRFINFATGRVSREEYFKSFDAQTGRNYRIAEFLVNSSTPNDRVFVWDPASPTIYALSRRLPPVKYTVPYHVADYTSTSEIALLIAENPPKFIILTSGNPLPEIAPLIKKKYLLIQQIDNADIYVRRQFK